jgi:hypothetical protein
VVTTSRPARCCEGAELLYRQLSNFTKNDDSVVWNESALTEAVERIKAQ